MLSHVLGATHTHDAVAPFSIISHRIGRVNTAFYHVFTIECATKVYILYKGDIHLVSLRR